VWVQVPPRAPFIFNHLRGALYLFLYREEVQVLECQQLSCYCISVRKCFNYPEHPAHHDRSLKTWGNTNLPMEKTTYTLNSFKAEGPAQQIVFYKLNEDGTFEHGTSRRNAPGLY
jgi:hypothetical protein